MPTLLRPLFRPQSLGLSLGVTLYASYQTRYTVPMRLDSGSSLFSTNGPSYQDSAKTPVIRRNGGGLNPRVVRDISSGSIIGLCTGLLVSTFSKSLALLIGLLVVGVQWASSHGINVIPYNRLQRYVTGIDLRSAVQDNVAFKISFGTTFAMAAFMKL